MSELIELASTPAGISTLLIAVLVFGTIPELLLQLAVHLYPPDHPRRQDLLADMEDVELWKRPFWVGSLVVMAPFEAFPIRRRARRDRTRSLEAPAEDLFGPRVPNDTASDAAKAESTTVADRGVGTDIVTVVDVPGAVHLTARATLTVGGPAPDASDNGVTWGDIQRDGTKWGEVEKHTWEDPQGRDVDRGYFEP
jgi:hypothetical protein